LVTGAKLNCHRSTMRKLIWFEIWCATGIREHPRHGLSETLTRSPVRCVHLTADRNPLRATPREILNGRDAQTDSVSRLASSGLT